jgi:hypothetical protein
MFNLLNTHKHLLPNYKIVRCYGHHCGCGADALSPVRTAITDNPSKTKTIILTCGKLTTGVTIKELNGVLMLCDCNSSEKYMQSAFRCQSPWYTLNPDGTKTIFKDKCYIIDFMPNRTLQQVKTYSIQLNTNKNKSQTQKVDNFIRYLPIFSFDGMAMKQLTPDELIQTVLLGFDVTNLAKRFYEHRLINMNDDLINLVNGNKDIERILNKIDVFRKFGKESMREIAAQICETNKDISDLEEKNLKTTDKNKKAQISAELKEKLKSKQQARSKMKDKLGTFLAKIPIFMYLNN